MLKFSTIMIGCMDPKPMADFYEKVFEKKPDMADGEDWFGWQMDGMFFTVGRHSEVGEKATDPKRMILNFETNDVKKNYERIKAFGATVVKELYEMQGMWFATFADPDGNYFQIVSPWESK